MTVINTNTKALLTQNAMVSNERELADSMAQLSTGKRINNAADDAAGLAITSRMTAQIRGLDQAVRNAGDGIALLQTIDGSTIEITNMLQRMRELAIQASNDSNANAERSFLDLEFQNLSAEINRIAENTQWNGFNILDGTARDEGGWRFQIGANANQTVFVSAIDLRNLIPSSSQAQQGLFEVMSGLQPGQTASVSINGQTFTITGEAAVAQSGEIEVANDLAADDYAHFSIGGQTFTFSGPAATATGGLAREGLFEIGNDLAAGDTATLEINGRVFTIAGASAVAQVEAFTLSSFSSPDALTLDVNGQTFDATPSGYATITAASAATLLAAQINETAAQAQVTKVSLSSMTSNGGMSIQINGQSFAILDSEHNVTTAVSAAAALAGKINFPPIAQINKVQITDAMVDEHTTFSTTINGQQYVVLGSEHSETTGSAVASLLASKINGGASAQQVAYNMVSATSTEDLQVTLNGVSYRYIADGASTKTAASVAQVLANKINGGDVTKAAQVDLTGNSVLLAMNFSINIDGTSYVVSQSEHAATTPASAAAKLASRVNEMQSQVSATASGVFLTVHALNAGESFSISKVGIGTQSINATEVRPNNTAQSAVSATVSGNSLVLTAKRAGEAFSTSDTATVGSDAVSRWNITANNTGSDAVSATTSGNYVVLTATAAGTGFSAASAVAITKQGIKTFDFQEVITRGTDLSVNINGNAFRIDQQIHNATTAASAAQLMANAINGGAAAQQVTYALSSMTSTGSITLALGGQTVTLQLSAYPLSTVNNVYAASILASVINFDPNVSGLVFASATNGTLTLSARTADATGFAFSGIRMGETLLAEGVLAQHGYNTVSAAVSATVDGDILTLTGINGQTIDVSNTLAIIRPGAQVLSMDSPTYTANTSAFVTINGEKYVVSAGAANASALATALAAKINGDNAFETLSIEVDQVTDFSAATSGAVRIGVAGQVVSVQLPASAITSAEMLTVIASAINNDSNVSGLVSAAADATGVRVTARTAGAGEFAISGIALSQTTATTGAASTIITGNLAQSAVSAVQVNENLYIVNLAGGSLSVTGHNGGSIATLLSQTALTRTVSAVDVTSSLNAGLNLTTANNVGQSAVTATVSGGVLILTSLDAGTAFSVGATQLDTQQIYTTNLSNMVVSANRSLSITVDGQRFAIGTANVNSVETATSAALVLASAINSGGEYQKMVMEASTAAATGSIVMHINSTQIAVSFSTGPDHALSGIEHTSASMAIALASAINANADLASTVRATTSAALVILTAVNLGPQQFELTSATQDGAATGLIGVLSTEGQGSQNSISATVDGAMLILTAKSAGVSVPVSNLTYGSATAYTKAVSNSTTFGTSINAVLCAANFTPQDAVSATVSGDMLVLGSKTPGAGFSVGSLLAGNQSYTASTVVSNDIGGYTASEMGSIFATDVSDAFSALTATASGSVLNLVGADNGALLSAGVLFDGTSSEAFIETVAPTVGTIAASMVAASLASNANSYFSNASIYAVDGTIRVTALTAGASIEIGVLDDGTELNAYTAVQAADAGGYETSEFLSLLVAETADIDGVTTRASGNALVVSATVAGTAFSTGTLNIDGVSAATFDLRIENADVGYNIKSFDAAQNTLEKLDEAMLFVNGERAKMGAVANRLEYAIDNLRNVTMNLQASRSHYEDADYAQATTNLAKHQIIAQAATSVLAQANQSQQNVLSLLNG